MQCRRPKVRVNMLQISDNAAALIARMTRKNGIPEGGLRIGIKAGGCSGLSYTFAWEGTSREGDHVFEGLAGRRYSSIRRAINSSRAPRSITTRASSAKGSCSTTQMLRAHADVELLLACSSQLPASSFRQSSGFAGSWQLVAGSL